MNGYEYILPDDRKWLTKFMEEVRQQTAYKMVDEDFTSNREKERYERLEERLRKTERVLKNLSKTKKNDTVSDIKVSSYLQIPQKDAGFIYQWLTQLKSNTVKKIEADGYPSLFTKQGDQRRLHLLNTIISPLKAALERHKKNEQVLRHLGEEGYASDGKTIITIIGWRSTNSIDIKFPDGQILHRQSYNKFLQEKIDTREDYLRRKKRKAETK